MGLLGATDIAHLQHCQTTRRVIFTQETDFLILAAAGVPHPGIIFCASGTRSIGQIIEMLILIDACMSEEEMSNHLEFI